jgi:putative glutathione S-transferase
MNSDIVIKQEHHMAVLDKGVWYPNKERHELLKEESFNLSVASELSRYHLYISYACPFAHRCYLVINYLGLQHAISVSSVAAKRDVGGWLFDGEHPDKVNAVSSLVALYQKAKPTYSGSVTVPVLWDKVQNRIISNDSSSMAMDLATKWLPLASNQIELVPEHLKNEITSLNNWLHQHVNRQVYHVGFASEQASYDAASEVLFEALEQLNTRIKQTRYLHGNEITLSDLFLIPTLVRFEAIYEVHFKANKKRLKSFEHLYNYMLDLVSIPSIRDTIDIDYMKLHYYFSHKHINPTGIVPAGPEISW